MGVLTAWCANPVCGRSFAQRSGPGRRKDYCSPACRRQAQRARDASQSAVSLPGAQTGGEVAERIAEASAALLEAERAGAALAELMSRFNDVAEQMEGYLPSAVHRARRDGAGWDDVALAAGVTVAAARGRWNAARVIRRVPTPATRSPGTSPSAALAAGGSGAGASGDLRARRQLVEALAFLQRSRAVSASAIEQATGLSAREVQAVLSGAQLPTWPELGLVAGALGAVPADLRQLWVWGGGHTAVPRTPDGAAEAFRQAVRGLHLAAGCPSAAALIERADGDITIPTAAGILRGEIPSRWEPAAAVVAALGGDASRVRPLWRAAGRPGTRAAPKGPLATGPEQDPLAYRPDGRS
ncbi:hypothetical protein ACFO3J_27240 [Streptomyces polygonati]|uniref:HTH cro/C1-type domain-containing protein n=1 Tax=Streptomyces polygonati TaxID=1617087 RepID=A0ABV8HST9_9ACTN